VNQVVELVDEYEYVHLRSLKLTQSPFRPASVSFSAPNCKLLPSRRPMR
jgi:hypothetical protein